MPTFLRASQSKGAPGKKQKPMLPFIGQRTSTLFTISGITKDSSGVALGNCRVIVFETGSDVKVVEGYSDGSGNYSLMVPNGVRYYVVAYLPGSPDVAGTTVNTVIGTQS